MTNAPIPLVIESVRLARMGLACAVEPGSPGIDVLLRQHGPEAVWESLKGRGGDSMWGRRAAGICVEEIAAETDRLGMRFIVPGDAEWPDGLGDLTSSGPVRELGGPPVGLWVSGPAGLADLCRRAVAIVGSRASSPYGEGVATDIAATASEAGLTIVSGGAYGIDAAAHRGALAADGQTVAVLAGGLEDPYPRGNAGLLERIRREVALVAEHPPGAHPTRVRFLARNRLIAALTAGTVIVEAAARSGASNTVSWALSLGRVVMAVPGPVTSALSVTPHRLIREAEAILVADGRHVVEALAPMGEQQAPLPVAEVHELDTLDPAELSVYESLPARGSRSVDELGARLGLRPFEVLATLGALEEFGLVQQDDGARWRLTRAHAGRERG